MPRKFDHEAAFAYWVSRGHERSLHALAKQFNVSRRAIGKAARKGNWNERLAKIEAEAQERADRKLAETRSEVRERHLKMVRAIESRGVQALQANQLEGALQGVRAIEAAIKLERLILDEPNERIGVTVQDLTRREVESFIARKDEPPDGADDY